jgi:hypothetical protein
MSRVHARLLRAWYKHFRTRRPIAQNAISDSLADGRTLLTNQSSILVQGLCNVVQLCSIVALLFGTALVCGASPRFPTAAFSWGPTQVGIAVGEASNAVPINTTKILDRHLRPPFGELFALPEVSEENGVKIGDRFDINLTGNFWVRATVSKFVYNKTEYTKWMLAIAIVDPNHRERYAAAIRAKLNVFLAEPVKAQRISDTGQIRSPLAKLNLTASKRASIQADLEEILNTKLHQAIRQEQKTTPNKLLSELLAGKANLTAQVEQIHLGQPFGVREHVLGTWTINNEPVFSIQGWKRPAIDRIESLEAIDGITEAKAPIIEAIGNWKEESLDDFTIENVFSGGRLLRHSSGYESSTIYLEQMTSKGREFTRSLYGM